MSFFKKLGKKIKGGVSRIRERVQQSPFLGVVAGAGIGLGVGALVNKFRSRASSTTVSPAQQQFSSGAAKLVEQSGARFASGSEIIGGESIPAAAEERASQRTLKKVLVFGGIGLGVGGIIIVLVKVL